MMKSVFWLGMAFALTFVVGPIGMIASQLGKNDPAGLYLVLDFASHEGLADQTPAWRGREIGPSSARFARMIHVPDEVFQSLLQSGAFLLPASALAALCGTVAGAPQLSLRNS